MKNTKRFFAIVMALMLTLCMTATAFAAETGSVTINNATEGNTYSVYKVFDGVGNGTGMRYTLVDGKTEAPTGFSVDAAGNVTYAGGEDVTDLTKDDIAAIKAYVEGDAAVATVVADSDTVVIDNLANGYYYITTTTGTAVIINTTNPDVTVEDKNETPTIDKTVKEDATGTYGDSNHAAIGDTVEFKTVVSAHAGALGYIVHDMMSAGLTLDADSITVVDVDAASYTVVTENLDDDCTFHVVFAQDYLDTIEEDTDITITYEAVLNENAKISPLSNPNDTLLEYGVDNKTEWDRTETYTYKFDLVKTDDADVVLTGAKFKMYDAATAGNEIAVVKVEDGVYRVAVEGETGVEIEAGSVVINGFNGAKTYYLEETEAPEGYNKLLARVPVTFVAANLDATIETVTLDNGSDADVYQEGGVQVVNKAGSVLPSTGGMGTTLFYIIGGSLVAVAGVLLIVKRRMRAN